MAHLNPNVIMAMALFAIIKKGDKKPRNQEIAVLLVKAKSAAIDIGDIGLRHNPGGGYWSDDVSTFIGLLSAGGSIKNEDPIELTESGRKLFREMIGDAFVEQPGEVMELAKSIGFDWREK